LAEFERVISRAKTQRFLPLSRGQKFVVLLQQRAIFVNPAVDSPPCRDPQDQIVLTTALGGQAGIIITADRDLIDDDQLATALLPHQLSILYPLDFLNLLTLA
jgi:putative PIN family toxin of toxin-antitoxin system